MMTWYPKLVLTKGETIGLSTVDGCNANAASWNAPYSQLEKVIRGRLPSGSYHHTSPYHPPKAAASCPTDQVIGVDNGGSIYL